MIVPITDVFHPTHLVSAALSSAGPPFNLRLLLPFAAFPLLLIALIIVLPGIRDQRTLSLVTVVVQLSVGALLIGSILLPFWKVSANCPEVLVHLRAFSRQRHVVRMGVAVGLHSLNISLEYIRPDVSFVGNDRQSSLPTAGLFLNEQFKLDTVSAMADEMHKAYTDGAPFPVLKILEYFSMGQQAFAWGRQYRNAGHYIGTTLWASFFVWLIQCLLLLFVPHHFAKAGLLCGVLTLFADVLFLVLSPSDLLIPFPSADALAPVFIHFRLGACFWMSVSSALFSLLFSSTLCALQSLRLYSLHTVLSASLDETVGPPKCRFGGGSSANYDHDAQHHRFGAVPPITSCPSGKTTWTSRRSHCSLDNDDHQKKCRHSLSSPTSTRSTSRISPTTGVDHQTFIIPAPLHSPSCSSEDDGEPIDSNKHSVASSIFTISGTSAGSMALPAARNKGGTEATANSGGSRRNSISRIEGGSESVKRKEAGKASDYNHHQHDNGNDDTDNDDALIIGDHRHHHNHHYQFTMTEQRQNNGLPNEVPK